MNTRYKVKVELNLPREIIVKAHRELSQEEIKERATTIMLGIFDKANENAFTIKEIRESSRSH